MKKHLKLISVSTIILVSTIIVAITGCKKENTPSDLDKETQQSFKELEKLMGEQNQIDTYKKQFESQTNNVIFKDNIPQIFAAIGITNFLVLNNHHPVYQLFDKNDLHTYLMGLKSFYFNNNVLNWYSKGTFDCGDYALGANWYAKAWHRNTKSKITGASIAVGTIFYTQDSTKMYHAINAVILKDKSILFFEPQTQSQIFLSPQEIKSISYIQF